MSVPVGRKTGGKYVEPVESVGNIISFKLTISAKNKKMFLLCQIREENDKITLTRKKCAEIEFTPSSLV